MQKEFHNNAIIIYMILFIMIFISETEAQITEVQAETQTTEIQTEITETETEAQITEVQAETQTTEIQTEITETDARTKITETDSQIGIEEEDSKRQTKPWQTEEELLRIAESSLRRLEKAVEKDDFSSAMCALNIWRSTATDAGIFDLVKYETFREAIHQKSVDNILWWINVCIEEKWNDDAELWLRIYHARSTAIDIFDQLVYDNIKMRIEMGRKHEKGGQG